MRIFVLKCYDVKKFVFSILAFRIVSISFNGSHKLIQFIKLPKNNWFQFFVKKNCSRFCSRAIEPKKICSQKYEIDYTDTVLWLQWVHVVLLSIFEPFVSISFGNWKKNFIKNSFFCFHTKIRYYSILFSQKIEISHILVVLWIKWVYEIL